MTLRKVIKLKPGDYVLATKFDDGDPCDHFVVGFFSHYLEYGEGATRYQIVDSKGNLFRGNGFRRAQKITKEEGQKMLEIFPQIGNIPGPSLWTHLRRIRRELKSGGGKPTL